MTKPILKEWAREYEKEFYRNPKFKYLYLKGTAFEKHLKSFISQLLKKQREEVIEEIEKAFIETMEDISNNTFEKTMLGKNSPFEVSQQDWESVGVEFTEIWRRILQKLLKGTL